MAVLAEPNSALHMDHNPTQPSERSQDLGNIVHLEHLNLEVPDRALADMFYADALGLASDPAMHGHPRVTWYNIGRQQFHIAKGNKAQRTPLPVTLVLPDHSSLLNRFQDAATKFQGTQFAYDQKDTHQINVTDPWGQRFVIVPPSDKSVFDRGIKNIPLPCAPGTAAAIGDFYEQMYKARVVYQSQNGAEHASILSGPGTTLTFIESSKYRDAATAIGAFEGWHIAFYLADFSSVFNAVNNAGLNLLQHKYSDKAPTLQEALKCSQFRMSSIIAFTDSPAGGPTQFKTGEKLYSFGHELRSMYHPRYLRSLMP